MALAPAFYHPSRLAFFVAALHIDEPTTVYRVAVAIDSDGIAVVAVDAFAVGNCWENFARQLSSRQASPNYESDQPRARATHNERLRH